MKMLYSTSQVLTDAPTALGHFLVLYGPKLEGSRVDEGVFRGEIALRPGEHAWLVLSLAGSERGVAEAFDPDVSVRDLERTAERSWVPRPGPAFVMTADVAAVSETRPFDAWGGCGFSLRL